MVNVNDDFHAKIDLDSAIHEAMEDVYSSTELSSKHSNMGNLNMGNTGNMGNTNTGNMGNTAKSGLQNVSQDVSQIVSPNPVHPTLQPLPESHAVSQDVPHIRMSVPVGHVRNVGAQSGDSLGRDGREIDEVEINRRKSWSLGIGAGAGVGGSSPKEKGFGKGREFGSHVLPNIHFVHQKPGEGPNHHPFIV